MNGLDTMKVLNEYETVRQRRTRMPLESLMLYAVGRHKEVQVVKYGRGDEVLTCKKCQRVASSVEIMARSTCKVNHPVPPGWAATTKH